MGGDDQLRKRVHRQAAVELGVPPYLSYRVKDPAQSGSGIHEIIQRIALRSSEATEPKLVAENVSLDKGSLYRYGDEEYGADRTRSFLQSIQRSIQQKFIPPFLAA